jgi:hypothetical protein
MRRRHAFTLVELLVAMALIILIMSVLSQAFIAATASVRDLAADHFEGRKRLSDPNFWNNGPPAEGFFRIWQGSLTGIIDEGADLDNVLPGSKLLHSFRSTDHMLHFTVKLRGNLRSDFFSASVPATSSTSPPLPALGLGAPDRRYQDTPNTYNAQWAEVEYFLRPVPDATGKQQDSAGNPPSIPTPLFALYRRQQLAVPDNSLVNPPVSWNAQSIADYLEVSSSPSPDVDPTTKLPNLHFNSPLDLTMPVRRFGSSTSTLAGVPAFSDPLLGRPTYKTMAEQSANAQAADLLLTDVLSFDVRVLLAGGNDFVDLFDPTVQDPLQGGYNNDNLLYYSPDRAKRRLTAPAVFDTWSSVTDDTPNPYGFDPKLNAVAWTFPNDPLGRTIPLYQNAAGQKISIKAIQITLRVWDFKTKQARQITIVQDL